MKIIKIFLQELLGALLGSILSFIYVVIFLIFSVVIILSVPTVFSWIFLEQETYLFFLKLWSLAFSVYVLKYILFWLAIVSMLTSFWLGFRETKKLIMKK